MLLNNSESFALLLASNLEVGSSRTVVSENIGMCVYSKVCNNVYYFCMCCTCIEIVAELVDARNISNVAFPNPNSNLTSDNSILIPASYIKQQSYATGKFY